MYHLAIKKQKKKSDKNQPHLKKLMKIGSC